MNRRPALAPLLGLVIAAAGCGGADPEEFSKQYAGATAPLETVFAEIGDLGPEAAGAEYAAIAADFDDVKERLAALEAPDGAQEELDALVTALGEYAEQVRQIGKAAKADDLDALDTAVAGLAAVGDSWLEAEEQLIIAVGAAAS